MGEKIFMPKIGRSGESISNSDLPQRKDDWKNPMIFEDYNRLRDIFRASARDIVEKIVREYISPGEKVIEIGAGIGELARLIPKEYLPGLIQTERSKNFAQLNKEKSKDVVIADVYNLPFDDSSTDVVIGFSMFDVLFEPEKAAQEINRVLCPGGRFIHFLDLEPNLEVMFDDVLSQGRIPFMTNQMPDHRTESTEEVIQNWVYYVRLATADKTEAEDALKRLELDGNPFFEIARKYIANPYATFVSLGIRGEKLLVEMSKELNRKDLKLKKFDPVDYFQEKMRNIFLQAGLIVDANGLEGSQSFISRKDEKLGKAGDAHNIFINRMGNVLNKNIPGVPDGMASLKSEIHVFVARKQ